MPAGRAAAASEEASDRRRERRVTAAVLAAAAEEASAQISVRSPAPGRPPQSDHPPSGALVDPPAIGGTCRRGAASGWTWLLLPAGFAVGLAVAPAARAPVASVMPSPVQDFVDWGRAWMRVHVWQRHYTETFSFLVGVDLFDARAIGMLTATAGAALHRRAALRNGDRGRQHRALEVD